ncbi:MAG: HDOD domain-containing protein [Spirochaetota bacterium]
MDILKRKRITDNIHARRSFTVSLRSFKVETLQIVYGIFNKLFSSTNQYYIAHSATNIMREIMTNAFKANAKRAFFQENGLNITDAEEYSRGMQNFKKSVVVNNEQFNRYLESHDYHVSLGINFMDGGVAITVSNNVPMTPEELERVNTRIAHAKRFNTIMEAFEDIHDTSEGAGLGIALAVITIKSLGIDPDNFQYSVVQNRTTVSLFIPSRIQPKEKTEPVKKHLYDTFEMPQVISGSVPKDEELFNTEEEAVRYILSEPMITAALFRTYASVLNKTAETVSNAVRVLGLDQTNTVIAGIRNASSGFKTHTKFNDLMDHSRRTAKIAGYIVDSFALRLNREATQSAALLHDIGKIVLFSAGNEMTLTIAQKLNDKRIATLSFLEEISIDVSHTEIGGEILRCWGVPEILCRSVFNHHFPEPSSMIHSDPQKVVYAANLLAMMELKLATFYDFDETVLIDLGIEKKNVFTEFFSHMIHSTI